MRYSILAEYYERLSATTKKLEKRDILAGLYRKLDEKDLGKVVLLSMGVVFPAGEMELGLAKEMMLRIIAKTYGIGEADIVKKFKETGDLGETAEFFAVNRKQRSLGKKELTAGNVFENLRKLPEISGTGSQERKVAMVSELLSNASPKEAKYLVRTILADMRIGVAGGIVRDAIAMAFNKEPKDVEHLFNVIGDYGLAAEMAKKGKMDAGIQLFRPVRVMLADRAPDLRSALSEFENPALEVKYDGFRIAGHKKGDNVRIFSRRLEDVTRQFPEIAGWVKENVNARECVIEGEVLAVDKSGNPKPFQELSRRIQRKYEIEKMVKEIPVQVNLFDLIFLDGESWMKKPLRKRWKKLKETIKQTKCFKLADHLETKDYGEAERFYKRSLAMGEEGVIVKNMDAHYRPGKRVGYWLKVKPIMEPLDLVIVGAEWGEGKRANWLGSLILAARKGNDFIEVGRMASGLTEEQMEEMTKKLKKLITKEEGKIVSVKPEIVLEVGYEEIQKSLKYPSGYALRFPRLLKIREPADKGPEDANTLKDVERLFDMQKKRTQGV